MLRTLPRIATACALAVVSSSGLYAAPADIVLSAANAVDVHGHWTRVPETSAAGGVMLTSTDTGWQNTTAAAPSPVHYVDFTFTPQPNTPYRVWLRLRAAGGSPYNDSVFVQFSDARDTSNIPRYRLGTTEGLVITRQGCSSCTQVGWGWSNDSYWLVQPTTLSFSTATSQTLRVQTREDGVQIDQIVLSPATYLSSAPGARDEDNTVVSGTPLSASTPVAGVPAALPGNIAADAFDAGGAGVGYHDTTAGNTGKRGRVSDVDLRRLAGGGYAVSWIAAGEWLNYSVNVTAAGDYILELDVASEGTGGTLHVNFNDENVSGIMSLPNTGSSTAFTTIRRRVTLNAGPQVAKLIFDTKAATASVAAIRVRPHAPLPYTGTSKLVPGDVNAAEYDIGGQGVSSLDTTPGNAGGQLRTDDVDVYAESDSLYYIGNTADGEWLEYGVSVAKTDDYLVEIEAASAADGSRARIEFTSGYVGVIEIPATGSVTTWSWIGVPARLTAGEQIMRVTFERGGASLRRIRIGGRFKTLIVAAGGDLQAAINAAEPGDTIVLQSGATYTGNFRLPAKAGSSYITIRSSAPDSLLPGDGVRISPASADHLPKLRSPNSLPALATDAYAHHYRIQFVEFLANANGAGQIIALGDASAAQNSLAIVPYDLILDRVYIHGDVALGQKRGIALNSAHTAIVNSYISEIKAVGQDSQAIGGWNGPGPFVISNNYLEAAGENVMFGGADPAIYGLVPSDIVFTRNYLSKPLTWRGTAWTVKNIFELKNAQRVLIDGNVMENNWLAAQAGYAILFKSVNQDGNAPWSVVQDVIFTNNVVRHVSSALNILGRDTRYPAIEANNIVIRNNLFFDVSAAKFGGAGRFLLINGGTNITIDHNTVNADGASVVTADVNPTLGFVFTNNVMPHNLYGIKGSGTGIGNGTLAYYFPNAQVVGNIIIGAQPSLYPTANYYPASADAVGFVDYAGGDYRLSATSIYVGGATDGTNPGVDDAALVPSDKR